VHLRSFAPICDEVRFSGDIELNNPDTSTQKGIQKPTKSYFFDGYNPSSGHLDLKR